MRDFRVGEKVGFQTYSINDPRVIDHYVGEVVEVIYESDFTFYHIAADFEEDNGETRTRLFRYISEDRVESFEVEEEEEVEVVDVPVMDSRDIFDMLVERVELCYKGDIHTGDCNLCPLRCLDKEDGLIDICEEVWAWNRKRGNR